jgi:hypothetical protein
MSRVVALHISPVYLGISTHTASVAASAVDGPTLDCVQGCCLVDPRPYLSAADLDVYEAGVRVITPPYLPRKHFSYISTFSDRATVASNVEKKNIIIIIIIMRTHQIYQNQNQNPSNQQRYKNRQTSHSTNVHVHVHVLGTCPNSPWLYRRGTRLGGPRSDSGYID